MIIKTNIAGINTKVDSENKKFIRNLHCFGCEFRGEPAVSLKVTDYEIRNFCSKYKGFDRDSAVLRLYAEKFMNELPEFGGFGIKAITFKIGSKVFVAASKSPEENRHFVSVLEGQADDIGVLDEAYAAVVTSGDTVFVYSTPFSKSPANEKNILSGIILPGSVRSVEKAGRKDIFDRFSLLLPLPKKCEQLAAAAASFDLIDKKVLCLRVPAEDPEAFYAYIKNLPE